MKNVMRLGKLEGSISLDTLNKKNLYGIGPVENLQGELMIFDGISYVSKVKTDSSMTVETSFDIKAPFFVYAQVDEWESETLPSSISNLDTLERYLDEKFKERYEPVVFKIEGQIDSATIHIVNLPDGSTVSSPEEAHQGIVYYPITNAKVDILGFFSRKHQAIFTHHDTFMHLHLITKDREMMGHLDEIDFGSNQLTLYWSK
ncbi:MAG: acetolactate decarboxylase [Flavobacteriaceae bacterium]|nr:acetolactate decarboxylase [Flavobacteriaceae bacterium]